MMADIAAALVFGFPMIAFIWTVTFVGCRAIIRASNRI